MLDTNLLTSSFRAGLTYADYVLTGTAEQQSRWSAVYEAARLSPAQAQFIQSMTRRTHILVVSGIWCGDCVEQCPLIARIAEANPSSLLLRFLDRDQHPELSGRLRINGGSRVPVALFLAEDFAFCSAFGDRTLSRYRALAARRLGPSCPTGIAPPAESELNATLQDWLDETERVQLMLRLSPRLRQLHGD